MKFKSKEEFEIFCREFGHKLKYISSNIDRIYTDFSYICQHCKKTLVCFECTNQNEYVLSVSNIEYQQAINMNYFYCDRLKILL
jgi:hypothetical protein